MLLTKKEDSPVFKEYTYSHHVYVSTLPAVKVQ